MNNEKKKETIKKNEYKVRMKRGLTGELEVEVYEKEKRWKSYTLSMLYEKEPSWMSKGYATFCRCVNAGYEVIPAKKE